MKVDLGRPVRYERNARDQWVAIQPCANPDHIEKFEWGYAVVSCKHCLMEVLPDGESPL